MTSMRLPAELVDRAVQALRRPLEAHELARILFPERDYPDITSARRAGHAAARDLIARGVAVKQADGTYIEADMFRANGHAPPEPAAPLAYENGQVVRVRKEVVGSLPLPEPPQPTAPQPPSAAPYMPPYPLPPEWSRWADSEMAQIAHVARRLVVSMQCYSPEWDTLMRRFAGLLGATARELRRLGRPELHEFSAMAAEAATYAPAW